MTSGDVAECQRRSERNAGPRIVTIHDRSHVVATGIETGDRHAIRVQDSRIHVGSKADSGAEVRRIDPKRVKRCTIDRRDAGIGRMSGIAEVALIDRRATPEFRVTPHPRIRVVIVHGQGQYRFFDADCLGKLAYARRLDQLAASDVSSYTPGKRLDTAKPIAPEKLSVADQIERTTRVVVAVGQHGADELVIRQCFIDETPARRVDRDDAGLRPVRDRVRENALAAIRPPKQ